MKGRSGSLLTGLISAAILVLALTGWTNPQDETDKPGAVTVIGDAEVRTAPDEAILSLGVETRDESLSAAQNENNLTVSKVLAVAEAYGVAPEHVQTEFVSIEPRYRDGYYDERDFAGYFVRRTVVITIRDVSIFENLLADALEAGANYVHSVDFQTTELRKYRDQARVLAIQAAQEKAGALATQLGQKLGEPRTIEEVETGWSSSYDTWWGPRWGGAIAQNVIQEVGGNTPATDGSFAPGQIHVNARVSVSFELAQ